MQEQDFTSQSHDATDKAVTFGIIDRRLAKLEHHVVEIKQLLEAQQIEKEWYTTAEVAEFMGVKQYTVQERWCNQGRVECEKDPDSGKWRIPGSEVRRLRAGGGLEPAR